MPTWGRAFKARDISGCEACAQPPFAVSCPNINSTVSAPTRADDGRSTRIFLPSLPTTIPSAEDRSNAYKAPPAQVPTAQVVAFTLYGRATAVTIQSRVGTKAPV